MSEIQAISTQHCLICKGGKKNRCLHWHHDSETNDIWVYCVGVCQRGYSLQEYCTTAGLLVKEFLKQDFTFEEAKANELTSMAWPSHYLSLSDPRAQAGVDYVQSRGLTVDEDLYYDHHRKGIVFPYYFNNAFVGAQTRFLYPKQTDDGHIHKIDTIPGTRLGLIFYGWNQEQLDPRVKAIVVTEGAFNALSIKQSLAAIYPNGTSPYKCIATSGSGVTKHQIEVLKDLYSRGYKIIAAPDSDEAGLSMLNKLAVANQGVVTHYTLTNDPSKDWNDMLQTEGREGLARLFLSGVKNA